MTPFAEKLKESGLTVEQFSNLSNTPLSTARKWYYGQRRTPGIAISWIDLHTRAKTLLLSLVNAR